jgi:hypothetical protein
MLVDGPSRRPVAVPDSFPVPVGFPVSWPVPVVFGAPPIIPVPVPAPLPDERGWAKEVGEKNRARPRASPV